MTNRHHKALPALLIAAAIVLAGAAACRSDRVYSESHSVDERGWAITDTLRYSLDIDDTIAVYDLFVDLRICRTYPYSNAFLFLRTTFPDGGIAQDTLECPLAYDDGQWRGKEGGRYVDNRYYFKRHVIFPATGTYHFSIFHGMRDTLATGFSDIGLTMQLAQPEQ